MVWGKKERAQYMRKWRKDNPAYERQKQTPIYKWGSWKRNLKYRYNTDPDWVGEKFLEQQEKCAICKRDIYYNVWGEREDKTLSLHVDHDHETGELRGLLCQDCNIILGKARDYIPTLRNAMAYLQKYICLCHRDLETGLRLDIVCPRHDLLKS